MRQRPKSLKPKAKLPVAPKSPKNQSAKVRDLEKRLAGALRDKAEAQEQLQTRDRELVEAQDHQTATSEILRTIAHSQTDVQPVFDTIVHSGVRLLRGYSGSTDHQRVIQLAAKHRLPAIDDWREHAQSGGLVAYGGSVPGFTRRAAVYVDRIFKGANPADLPVERATTFELAINLNTAKALGLTIPQTLLLRADEIISVTMS